MILDNIIKTMEKLYLEAQELIDNLPNYSDEVQYAITTQGTIERIAQPIIEYYKGLGITNKLTFLTDNVNK